jgi:pentafunctional AROM polypeptide
VSLTPSLRTGVDPSRALIVRVPGSKSVSNRALLLAGLARGETRLRGLLASDDTAVVIAALGDLGARVETARETGEVVIRGTGGVFTFPPLEAGSGGGGGARKALYVQNAGTASRFLASILPLLPFPPSPSEEAVTLTGNARMAVRPIGPLVDALREQGVRIE